MASLFANEEIEFLRRELERHNRLYYVDARPEITDREYDSMMARLIALEKAHPEFMTPDSPSVKVGGAPIAGFSQVTQPPENMTPPAEVPKPTPQRPEVSLGGENTFAGAKQKKYAPESLGDEATFGGGRAAADDHFTNDMEIVDLTARYKVESVLGKGGMGKVLLATDTRLKRKVAIKRVLGDMAKSQTAVRRFLTEAQSIAAINHPNIVQVYDYGRDKDGPFLILEYVDGQSLWDRCQQGPIPLQEAVDLTCQLCDGLTRAHELGIVHRDLKPANVLLTKEGVPKLTDFGLARMETGDTGQTMSGAVLGTLDFMPPEQRRDATQADARSDLWSLAATLYQMVTGDAPRVIDLDAVPAQLRTCLSQALKTKKEDRYQTARVLRDALQSSLRPAAPAMMAEADLDAGECPRCHTKNDSNRKFCKGCGGSLRLSCVACTKQIPVWEQFCGECGAKQSDVIQIRVAEYGTQHEQDAAIQHFAEAQKHRAAFDYPSAMHAIEQIPAVLRSGELDRYLADLHSLHSEVEALIKSISDRVQRRNLDGLRLDVDRAIALRGDRVDLQKLRVQLHDRESKLIAERDEAYARAAALLIAGDAVGGLILLKSVKWTELRESDRDLQQRLKEIVDAEQALTDVVQRRKADGVLEADAVIEMYLAADDYLKLNPCHAKIREMHAQLTVRMQKPSLMAKVSAQRFASELLSQLPVSVLSNLPVAVLSNLPVDVLFSLPVNVRLTLPCCTNANISSFKLLPGATFTMGAEGYESQTDICESYRKYLPPRNSRIQFFAKKTLPGHTVGIDLGATYSAIAMLDHDGNPKVLQNADGRDITPSVVLLDEARVVVGPSFERISVANPESIVEAIKREMGNKNFYVAYQNKKLTPEFISALILKKMKQDAEKIIGPIANAVITVPYYFNDVRRKATQDAGRIAGLNVIDIISEPTAATLAYTWSQGEPGRPDLKADEKTILIYDLGGGSFDVAVVRYTPTSLRVLARDGDVMPGGLDWSKRLSDHLVEQFKCKFGADPSEDPETMLTLRQEAEDAKRDLSCKLQVPISVYFKGNTLSVSLSRTEYERMTADLLGRTKDTTELVLQQSGVAPGTLDEVVLVGGSTYMPVVQKMLHEICQREPSRALAPERAVAEGAAIYASMVQVRSTLDSFCFNADTKERLLHFDLREILSKSWGLAVVDENQNSRIVNHLVLMKNSSLPCRSSLRLELTATESANFRLKILRGDAIDTGACDHYCDVLVKTGPRGFVKGYKIDVIFSCAKENDVAILVFDAVSGNKLELVKEFPSTFLASGKDIQSCADSIRNEFHLE